MAVDVVLVLVTVNRRTTSSPALITGSGARVPSSRNSLVRIGTGSTKRSSEAMLPTTGEPSTVPVTAPVVLV